MGSSGINARYMGINTLISTYNYHHAIHCPSPKRPKDQRRLHRQGRQRKVHDGLETARQQDVRDLLLLAAALLRRFDQASPILVEQRLDSVPRIRGPGPRLHWRPRLVWFGLLRQRQLLRQQILGHVEVADVRLQQRRRSHPRSQGVRQGIPELLRQMRRPRQHQASAMCWLLVLQTEVGPDGRWRRSSRCQTSLSSLVLGFECRFTWWYSIIKL